MCYYIPCFILDLPVCLAIICAFFQGEELPELNVRQMGLEGTYGKYLEQVCVGVLNLQWRISYSARRIPISLFCCCFYL